MQSGKYTIAIIDGSADRQQLPADIDLAQHDFSGSGDAAAFSVADTAHATAMVKTILSIAPVVRILSLKVTDQWGMPDLEAVNNALQWIAAQEHIDLVCIAAADWSNCVSCGDAYPETAVLLDLLIHKGIIIVAPAGNWFSEFDETDGMAWPAIHPGVVSVGAIIRNAADKIILHPDSQRLHHINESGSYTTVFAFPGEPGRTSGAVATIAGYMALMQSATQTSVKEMLAQRTNQLLLNDGRYWPCWTT
ncbi:S8/S53 family peptidase [Sediminibacterium ginsengisoli]|uniref:Subtilase family protein n=1 Tax=Sediminibacterium ginsengisoli TaxID=413434 RepID=A0A1T4JTT4_9BACT|nr:S8/S53 family peptidase [Sediminibacterium ginsengisoli]SJZ33622.1 Subtilase family protein [Sediminibacterium ginsengisoli]